VRNRLSMLAAVTAALLVVAACSGGSSSGGNGGNVVKGGVLRIGDTSKIDSLNPFVAQQQNAYVAFANMYPTLVQYKPGFTGFEGAWAKSWTTSKDGLTWTFALKPGKWSDGKPLTSADAVWSGRTVLKYKGGPTALMASALGHVKSVSAPDPHTLVVTYDTPVANVLSRMNTWPILPKHVWAPVAGSDGKGLKTYVPTLPVVAGGPFTVTKFDKNGTTIFKPNPGYYGQKPNVDAVGLQYFTNQDAAVQAFKSGQLDEVWEVPANAVASVRKSQDAVVTASTGAQENDFIFNSNPKKPHNRELLDPQVRAAFEAAIDRQQIAKVVFAGFAVPVASIISPRYPTWVNKNVRPTSPDVAKANKLLDQKGYTRGPDGIRVADGHKMAYDVITPTGQNFDINRQFSLVRNDLRRIGVQLTQDAHDGTTAFSLITAPQTKYLDFDLAMWDWVGEPDPDFMLSVLTCGQYGGWSDTGYCDPAYDRMYKQQGVTVDAAKRHTIVDAMQQKVDDEKPYIMLVNLKDVSVHSAGWSGYSPAFTAYSTRPWVEVHRTS